MRSARFPTAAAAAVALAAACGGGEPAAEAAPKAAPAPAATVVPVDWVRSDEAARTVTVQLIAGQTPVNGGWNFNGRANGDATVIVPEGWSVTIELSNQDAKAVHSVGVAARMADPIPVALEPTPVFEGALSANTSSTTDAAGEGSTETITFTAATAGDYVLASFVPGQAAAGMWIGFRVVAGATAAAVEMIM